MANSARGWLLIAPIVLWLAGCAPAGSQERLSRFYDAVRNQPNLRPAAVAAPEPAAGDADPIAKADVVVFAARPGDVVVAAHATINQALAHGKRVVVVYLTDGDAQTSVAQALAGLPADTTPAPHQYLHGAAVLQEMALKVAASAYGIDPEDLIFLSYPDGVLHLLDENTPDHVIRSPYTEKDGVHDPNVTPYRILRSGFGFPYSFNHIMRDLNDVLVELNPREIYLPSRESGDETVAAAGRLVARSLRETAPPNALVLAYGLESDGQSPPDKRVAVGDPAEKVAARDLYAARTGAADWPALPTVLREEEVFWEFDYAAKA